MTTDTDDLDELERLAEIDHARDQLAAVERLFTTRKLELAQAQEALSAATEAQGVANAVMAREALAMRDQPNQIGVYIDRTATPINNPSAWAANSRLHAAGDTWREATVRVNKLSTDVKALEREVLPGMRATLADKESELERYRAERAEKVEKARALKGGSSWFRLKN